MTPEGNFTASHNGRMIEEIVQTVLPNLVYVGKNLDAEYLGKPLEIKSCQRTCKAYDKGAGGRAGRFWFREDQDKTLKEENGYYALVVHDQGNMVFFCLAEARRLLKDFNGVATISWKSIARRV